MSKTPEEIHEMQHRLVALIGSAFGPLRGFEFGQIAGLQIKLVVGTGNGNVIPMILKSAGSPEVHELMRNPAFWADAARGPTVEREIPEARKN